jgi:hypothetical protein
VFDVNGIAFTFIHSLCGGVNEGFMLGGTDQRVNVHLSDNCRSCGIRILGIAEFVLYFQFSTMERLREFSYGQRLAGRWV